MARLSAPLPPLLAISDRRRVGLEAWVESLRAAGVRWLQLREKDLDDRRLLEAARVCRAGAGDAGHVLVNGRADLCRLAGLAGVHLPAGGAPAAEVRKLLGPEAVVGRSTHGQVAVERAEREGVDYVVFGPVFPPSSKPGARPVGLEALARAARASVPVYALGGITMERLAAVAATGAAGVAGISLFTDDDRIGTLAGLTEALFRRTPRNRPAEGTSR
jgi:thiamine-phosphate pyrophosphorylase